MKKLVTMVAAATAVMTYGAEAEDGLVRVRENVMPVRNQRDLWAVGGGNGSFAYTNGEGRVSFKGDWICLYHYKRTPEERSFRFLGVDAVTRESPAEALRVDVETGNPFHVVRDGKGEKAELVLRNPSDSKLAWNVHLKVEDFSGYFVRFKKTIQDEIIARTVVCP